VIGADDPGAADRVAGLYQRLGRPMLKTGLNTAEMGKHASNAFLATSISFMNEIADLCGAVGADPLAVARILKLDRRIGPHAYLSPGLGFAGGTLGRELRVLQQFGAKNGLSTAIADATVEVNDARAGLVSQRLREALESLENRRIAVHGLTYKTGTSTLRRAVSLDVVQSLVAAGATVVASDPLANLAELAELPFQVCRDPHEAAAGSDALVMMTDAGSTLDLSRLRHVMSGDVILDARSALEPSAVRRAGFRYASLWEVDR
jgi:UDPglucose 6-dehydrogenase